MTKSTARRKKAMLLIISPTQDDAMDRKAGIKEDSARDRALDRKRGIKESAEKPSRGGRKH